MKELIYVIPKKGYKELEKSKEVLHFLYSLNVNLLKIKNILKEK